jgi:inner membrane transporter RhtA
VRTASVERAPAIGLIGAGAVSVQFGAAFATHLFGRVGPAGAATLRLVVAAVLLVVVLGARSAQSRPATRSAADRAAAVTFGLVLAAMNLCFYEAIARIPLGAAVTLEFSGPLAVALVSSRRLRDGVWAAMAGVGVALLASGVGRTLDVAGVVFALMAGAFWIGYILLSKEVGRRWPGLEGLAWAMAAGGLVLLPFGVVAGGTRLLQPVVLGLGLLVAVMSSVVPYSLELLALRRVSPRSFGVMLSLDPAVAAAAGFALLGQSLDWAEWVALALVVTANLGNALAAAPAAGSVPP